MSISSPKFQQELYRRYLLWAYKTTRESFERIERKTTQLVIDAYLRQQLSTKQVDLTAFDQYIKTKQSDELAQKYTDSTKATLNPQYIYVRERLEAIELAVVKFLGKEALVEFEQLFEAEFSRRILESRDHH